MIRPLLPLLQFRLGFMLLCPIVNSRDYRITNELPTCIRVCYLPVFVFNGTEYLTDLHGLVLIVSLLVIFLSCTFSVFRPFII